jgi:hypothetical protein
MRVNKGSKNVLQSLLVIGVLLAVLWSNGKRLGMPSSFSSEGSQGASFAASGAYDPAEEECEYDEVYRMPAYVDLQESIRRMLNARSDLSRSAADFDETQLVRTAASYRKAITEVRAGFARLKNRVAPDAFPMVAEELVFCGWDEDNSYLVNDWELGNVSEELER